MKKRNKRPSVDALIVGIAGHIKDQLENDLPNHIKDAFRENIRELVNETPPWYRPGIEKAGLGVQFGYGDLDDMVEVLGVLPWGKVFKDYVEELKELVESDKDGGHWINGYLDQTIKDVSKGLEYLKAERLKLEPSPAAGSSTS